MTIPWFPCVLTIFLSQRYMTTFFPVHRSLWLHTLYTCLYIWAHCSLAMKFANQVKPLLVCLFLCQKSGKFTSCLYYYSLCPYPSGGSEDVPSVGLFSINTAWNSVSPLSLQMWFFCHHGWIISYYLMIAFLPSVPLYLLECLSFLRWVSSTYSLFIVLQYSCHLVVLSLIF